MKVVAIFLVLFDILHAINIVSFLSKNPLFVLTYAHAAVDGFSLLTISRTKDLVVYNIIRIVYVASAAIYTFIAILTIQIEMDSIYYYVLQYTIGLYLITDIIQLVFISTIITTTQHYNQYLKRN